MIKFFKENKVVATLLLFLLVTIVLDFFLNGMLRTIIINGNENDLVSGGLKEELAKAGTAFAGRATSYTIDKSLMTQIVTIFILILGIALLIIASVLTFIIYKNKSGTILIYILIGLIFAIGIYQVIAGGLKIGSFSYEIKKNQMADLDKLSVDIGKWLKNANWENWMTTIFGSIGLIAATTTGYAIAKSWY